MSVASKGLRAVDIPEVVQNIFELADDRTRAAGALVCRGWSQHALDELWRALDSLIPVFRLLSPLEASEHEEEPESEHEEEEPEFEHEEEPEPCTWTIRPPEEADWQRFSLYTRRVRKLECSDELTIDGVVRPLALAAFKDLHFYRPQEEALFPALRTLQWTTSYSETSSAMLQLLSASVTNLTIFVQSSVAPSAYKTLISQLKHRLPNSNSFTLSTPLPLGDVSTALAATLQTMPRLHTIDLPQFYLSEEILRAASRLEGLTSLCTLWNAEGIVYDEMGMRFYFEEGWFDNLKSLQVDCHPQTFATFLSASVNRSLSNIGLSTRRLDEQSDLRAVLEAAATSCPGLEVLTLNVTSKRGEMSRAQSIKFTTIRPLLACKHLRELSISHDYPITLQKTEFLEMAAAWEDMNYLELASDPFHSNVGEEMKGVSLATLGSVGSVFRNLTDLGVYVSDEEVPRLEDGWSLESFPALQTFVPGASPVPQGKTKDVALFLAIVCPKAKLEPMHSGWRSAAAGVDRAEEVTLAKNTRAWGDVQELMGDFVRCGIHSNRSLVTKNSDLEEANSRLAKEVRALREENRRLAALLL